MLSYIRNPVPHLYRTVLVALLTPLQINEAINLYNQIKLKEMITIIGKILLSVLYSLEM